MSKNKSFELSVTVNGEDRNIAAGETISGLLKALGIEGGKVAVEHNRAIAPRSAYNTIQLADGDQLEIVRFVGGG
ncbi:MAG: sulfur carrier protein ThiS [Pseudomonadota bacterium]